MLRFSEKSSRSQVVPTAALRILPALCLFSLLLLSCATVPPSQPPTGWLAVLPRLTPDSLYVSADVASSWDFLKALAEATGSETKELERITGNLNHVHARIRLSPDRAPAQLPEISLIALGKLWSGSVARQLNRNPSWQRIMLEPLPGRGFNSTHWSYRTYWRKDQLEIAVPEPGVFFLTVGVPDAAAENLLRRLHSPEPQSLPPQAQIKSEAADIFFYIPDPAALAAASAAASTTATSGTQDPGALLQNLPIRQGWVSARRRTSDGEAVKEDRGGYELEAVFLLGQVDSPRSVELLLRLMLTLWLRKVQVEDPVQTLKAVTFRVDSQSARIESFFLESGEIASFVRTLLPENFGDGPP